LVTPDLLWGKYFGLLCDVHFVKPSYLKILKSHFCMQVLIKKKNDEPNGDLR